MIVCGVMLQLCICGRQFHIQCMVLGIELAGVYVYVAVYTPVSLFTTLDFLQAIQSLLLQVVNRLDAIEPRITAIE